MLVTSINLTTSKIKLLLFTKKIKFRVQKVAEIISEVEIDFEIRRCNQHLFFLYCVLRAEIEQEELGGKFFFLFYCHSHIFCKDVIILIFKELDREDSLLLSFSFQALVFSIR